MGHPSIPLSVISKAAELQFQYTVDKVFLGNRWLRKATGIQPKFPYLVDSFERRYILCCSRAFETEMYNSWLLNSCLYFSGFLSKGFHALRKSF